MGEFSTGFGENRECFLICENRYRGGDLHMVNEPPKNYVEKSLKNVEKCAIL